MPPFFATRNVQPSATVAGTSKQAGNPRAGATVPATVLDPNNSRVGVDQATLGSAAIGPVKTWTLPMLDDINDVELTVAGTYTSGATVTGSIQASTFFSQILIQDSTGKTLMTILPEFLHPFYEHYSEYRNDFTDTSTTVAASQTAKALPVITIPMPFVNLPVVGGPYQIAFVYQAISGLGSWATDNVYPSTAATGLTAATVSVTISAGFGDVNGMESKLVPTSFSVSTGVNDLAQQVPSKNSAVADVYMYNFAADGDLDHISLTTPGSTAPQFPYLTEGELAARWSSRIQATRGVGEFFLLPNSQVAFTVNTSFQVVLTSSATTTVLKVAIYRLSVPGS